MEVVLIQRHMYKHVQTMKLPPFSQENDDLDAYLNRFERTCTAFSVPQEQ